MKSTLIATSLVVAVLVGVLAPSVAGRAQAVAPAVPVTAAVQAPPAFLDKTRFLAHVGLAYFAFHHFVWARYKNHQLDLHHKANLIKAGIALLFSYHELKVAYGIANKSNSKLLHALVHPLNVLIAQADSVGTSLKSGQFNAARLLTLNTAATTLQTQAAANGFAIKDIPVTVPGA